MKRVLLLLFYLMLTMGVICGENTIVSAADFPEKLSQQLPINQNDPNGLHPDVTISKTASELLKDLFTTIDLMDADIAFLQKEMETGHVTSAALTQMYIDRINFYDKQLGLNSIIAINPNAVNDAKALDQERREGIVKGPLHGIPIVVKANIDIKGMAASAGSKALENFIAEDDAFVIQKLKEAGAVILAQANMSEFAMMAVSSRSSLGGIVHNAYDTSRTPMGSSGGTAVAVTSNFAAAGLGTDTGGSIRNPSSAANLYGFKPGKGLVSTNGVFPLVTPRDTVGPMARTAEDMALILETIAGTDERDDYTQEADADSLVGNGYTDSLSADALKGMRIAWLDYSFIFTYDDGETEGEDENTGAKYFDSSVSFGTELNPGNEWDKRFIRDNSKSAGKKLVTIEPDPKIRAMLDKSRKTLEDAGAELVDLSGIIPEEILNGIYYGSGDSSTEYDINRFLHEKGSSALYKTLKDMYNANPDLENLKMLVDSLCPYRDQSECDPDSYLADSFENTVNPYTEDIGKYKRAPSWPNNLQFRTEISQILDEQKIDAVMYLKFRDVPLDQIESNTKDNSIFVYDYLFGSILGFPDVSLPMGFSDTDSDCPIEMPLALNIFSTFGNEEKLMKIAYAYEQQAGKDIRRMPALTPALADPALNAYLEELIDRANAVDYSRYGKQPGCKAQMMLDACSKARNVNTNDPYAVYQAAEALAAAYDAVMEILTNDKAEDPACPGNTDGLAFFRMEGDLPETGITTVSTGFLTEKPASVNYRPLGMELLLPSLGLKSEIVSTTPENGSYPIKWLGEQTGWLEGSSKPGEGISVLAAHNTLNAEEYGPFALISTMEEGDRIFLRQEDGTLNIFEVYANEKIGAQDREALEKIAASFDNTLTLLTCEDERIEGGYASRRIVAAKMLSER